MKNKRFLSKRGFTLIELLVVIAIIGLLASIVMVNLNSARTKAKNAAIKSALAGLRSASEISFESLTPNSYEGVCTELGAGIGNSTLTQTAGTDFKRTHDNIVLNGQTPVCNESASSAAYAVWSPLNGGGWWCIDSVGSSELLAAAPGEITVCP